LENALFSNEMTAAAYKKVTFKQATLLKVHKGGNFIDVQSVGTGQLEKVEYDVLVICTGFAYQGHVRGDATSIKERRSEFEGYWQQIEAAREIAIVGGGIVGVEMAGEYAVHFKNNKIAKKITLYSSSGLLATLAPKAGAIAETFLKAHNVEIKKERFNHKAEHPDTLVIPCTGYSYPTGFMKEDFSDCLAANG
jgi:NADH dehydrogenase FAD-containing subunit